MNEERAEMSNGGSLSAATVRRFLADANEEMEERSRTVEARCSLSAPNREGHERRFI